VYRHPSVSERLSVQPDHNGQAKPYQIRDLRRYVEDFAAVLPLGTLQRGPKGGRSGQAAVARISAGTRGLDS
jgi:hypothetical protein